MIDTASRTIARIAMPRLERAAEAGGARIAALGLCALMAGCASHVPLRSGQATSYAALPVELGKRAKDGLIVAPLDHACLGAYRRAVFDPPTLAIDRDDELRPATRDTVLQTLNDEFRRALAQHYVLIDGSSVSADTLRVRIRVTRITEASPWLNAATSLVAVPLRNGALAVEGEAVDALSGRQCALYVWAGEGGVFKLRELSGNFSRAGHARLLTRCFAAGFAAYLAPLRGAPK